MTDETIEQKINHADQQRKITPEQNAPKPESFEPPEAVAEATPETEGYKPAEALRAMGEAIKLKRRPKTILPQVRDEVAVKIEKILEDGVADAYSRLSPIAKQEFKIKGEETALKIRELLKGAHVKVKKIFRLILSWLKLLPGVNRFFIEQEAKIKTDRIIALHKK